MPPQTHNSSHSRSSKRSAKDRRMTIDHLLYGTSSRQPSSHTYESMPQVSNSASSSGSLSSSATSHSLSPTAAHTHGSLNNALEGISLSSSPTHHNLHQSASHAQSHTHSHSHLHSHSHASASANTHTNALNLHTTSPESSSIITARRDFVIAITRPSTRRGYLECRLCNSEVWGPNGRYHIDKCRVLQEARETARKHGVRLTSIAGFSVHPDVFKSTKKPEPKPAKIPGFVMSHSVSMTDPNQALTEEEIDSGMQRGRKGYVRCLRCNSEVFAPNARNHALHCRKGSNLGFQ